MAMEDAIASVINTGLQMYQQNENNNFNSGEAAANRDWQQYMSNTAYRRAVKDLNAAGLSPMLAYGKSFGGASTPTGSSASAANVGSYAQAFSSGAMIKAMLDKTRAETERETTAADVNRATAVRIHEEIPNVAGVQQAQIGFHTASADQAVATASNIRQEMGSFEKRMEQLGYRTGMDLEEWTRSMIDTQVKSGIWKDSVKDPENFDRMVDFTRQRMIAEAVKIQHDARIRGLEVPEAIKRAAFWSGSAGDVKPYLEAVNPFMRRR